MISMFVAVLLFYGCSIKNDFINDKVIDVNLNNAKSSNSLNSIKSIEYISLETNQNNLIKNINKIIFNNEKFFILDLDLNSIFIFNRDGSFYDKISKIGKGPGEYIDITDFDIDINNNNIWIYDNLSSKIIIYNHSLTEFNEIYLKYFFEEFCIKDNGVIYVRNLYSKGIVRDRVAEIFINENKYKSVLDLQSYNDDFKLLRYGRYMFYRSNNTILFNPRFKKYIYAINANDVNRYLSLSGKFPDENFIDNYKKDPVNAVKNNNETIFSVNNIYENKDMISMSIKRHQYISELLIYSKSTNDKKILNLVDEEMYFGNGLIKGVADDKFISIFISNESVQEDWFKRKVRSSSITTGNKDVLLNQNIDDNPILVLMDFKYF